MDGLYKTGEWFNPDSTTQIGRIAGGTLKGLVNSGVQSAITGHRPNWGAVAAESFGGALGDEVVAGIQNRDMQLAQHNVGKVSSPEVDLSEYLAFSDYLLEKATTVPATIVNDTAGTNVQSIRAMDATEQKMFEWASNSAGVLAALTDMEHSDYSTLFAGPGDSKWPNSRDLYSLGSSGNPYSKAEQDKVGEKLKTYNFSDYGKQLGEGAETVVNTLGGSRILEAEKSNHPWSWKEVASGIAKAMGNDAIDSALNYPTSNPAANVLQVLGKNALGNKSLYTINGGEIKGAAIYDGIQFGAVIGGGRWSRKATGGTPNIGAGKGTGIEKVKSPTGNSSDFNLLINEKNGILSTLSKEGVIDFKINAVNSSMRGSEMFSQMMNHYGGNVQSIRGNWMSLESSAANKNLGIINKLTAQGIPLEKAIAQTWTANQAAKHGFTQPKIILEQVKGTPGNYTKVEVLFSKPK